MLCAYCFALQYSFGALHAHCRELQQLETPMQRGNSAFFFFYEILARAAVTLMVQLGFAGKSSIKAQAICAFGGR